MIQKPLEKKPEKVFTLEDFLYHESAGRKILSVPVELLKQVGGREVLTRKIFPEVFNGAYPIWGDDSSDNHYLIELEYDASSEKIEEFKQAILDWGKR